MATRMQQRRGTAAQWISTNSGNGPILAIGEIGYESDTNKFKIGDGVNHWLNLSYFVDLATTIAGAPGLLNSLDELAAAIGDDPAFFTTVATNLSNHQADTTAIHGIADTSLLVTTTGTQTLTNKTITTPAGLVKADVGLGNVDNTSDANKPVSTATQTALNLKANSSEITELAQDAVNTAIVAGTGLDKTYDDNANTITIDIDSTVATLTGTQTLTNKTITAPAGLVKADVGLGNVDNTADTVKPISADTQTALNLKAPLASPALTGTPTAPTAAPGTNTTQVATTAFAKAGADAAVAQAAAYTDASVASIIDSAPGALNTLNELAAAINDDASYAATMTASLATKASTSYVDTQITSTLNTAGGNLSAHASDTTGIHGIEDTAQLATQTLVSSSIATAIAPLATTAATTSAISTAVSNAVSGLTKSSVGLSNVDNTSDLSKPVSTAQATAIATAISPLATTAYVDEAVGDVTDAQSAAAGVGIDWNAGTDQYDIDSTVATKTYADTAVSTHNSDTTDVHGIANTALLATSSYVNDQDTIVRDDAITAAANLLTSATKTNITITGSKTGLVITAENGVGDSTTDNLTEGSNNKYFTDERAQDAIGNSVGTGLSYNDATGAISVNTTAIQAKVANVDDTEIGYLNGVTSAIQTQIDTKAALVSPTFTGTVSGITKSMVGLGSVDNTADSAKPVSTATQTALDLKAPIASPTFTGTVSGITKSMVGLGSVDNTADTAKPVSTATQTALDLKAPLSSPALTGVPTAPTATAGTNTTQVATTAFVGTAVSNLVASAPAALDTLNELATALGNDASFSTTITNSIGLKAPLASPTFTGTVSGITKSMVGLGSVDNTADTAKPISTATQTALDLKLASATAASTYAPLASPTFTGTATIPTLTLTNPLTAANGGTGLSSLGTGVSTFLATPTSANFAAMITNEDGSGNVVLSEIATSAQTASYTLVLADRGKLVEMNVGSANTLTVPLNSSVAYPVGTQIDILQVGSGQTTVAATAGVTVNATPGLKIRAQWGGATLIKRAENTWVLIGDLTA